MRITIVIFAILALSISACKKNNTDKTPYIANIRVSKTSVTSGSSEDTVIISFRYTDGDANIGRGDARDIFIKDNRVQGATFNSFALPEIPDEYIDPKKGISGNAYLPLSAALFLILRPDHPNGDTVSYEVYMVDKDGKESNHLTTPDIYINP